MKTIYERSDVVPLLTEIFRDFGYEGTTLSRITERTGIGKGSLYHFFPGGKEEMASAVLLEVDAWFECCVYEPLRRDHPEQSIAAMWRYVEDYFLSGRRICLVGSFALDDTRERFASAIAGYFERWIEALQIALVKAGWDKAQAHAASEEAVISIQGAIVLSRSLGDDDLFIRCLRRQKKRLAQKVLAADLCPSS